MFSLINSIYKIYLLYFFNNIKYNFYNNILNIKYRVNIKNRAFKRAYDYMYNQQLYGYIKWN